MKKILKYNFNDKYYFDHEAFEVKGPYEFIVILSPEDTSTDEELKEKYYDSALRAAAIEQMYEYVDMVY